MTGFVETTGTEAFTWMSGGGAPFLIVADHASAHVPDDIDLGIAPHLLSSHIAVDIGVAQVAALLVERLQCSALLGGVSRLVIDLNREETSLGLIPAISDGHVITGNEGVDRQARIARFYHPYHDELTQRLSAMPAPFILSLHSFTPALKERPEEKRPWEIGILYNEDDRAAHIAINMLKEAGISVGDQQPYSGRTLNATMNRHAEGAGHPYLGVEMRQDIAETAEGQHRFADLLVPVMERCRALLA